MDRTLKTRPILAALAVTSALLLFAGGCNSGTEEPAAPAPETPAATTPPVSPATGTESSSETEIDPSRRPESLPEGVLAELPSNYPKDLPVYPNASPAQGRGGQIEGKELAAVQLLSNDSPEKTRDFYERELSSKGWEIEEMETRGDGAGISGTRGDCKASILIVPSEDGGSDIFTVSECGE